MKDQKWKNMKLQGHNLIFFLQELKPEFTNITGTKSGINPNNNKLIIKIGMLHSCT